TPFEVESGTSKYDLLLSMRDENEGLAGSLEYDTDLFDSTTISGLLARWEILLKGIVADPDKKLFELPFLTELEREQQLLDWNDTKSEFPRDKTIHELFEEQVEKSPDAVAAVFQDRQLTYQELNYRANQLARYLRKLGVKPDTLVGICSERSIDMAIAMLGTLKAGAAYMPLDPNYPGQRLNFMLQDSRAPVVLAQEPLVSRIQSHSTQVVCLDTARDVSALESGENPKVPCCGESIAYVLYTSGSTGTPKGVVMQHRPLRNLISWQIKNFSFPAAAKTLQFASLSFDVSFQEIFSTWCAGGALVIVTEDVRRDPAALLRCLIAESVERLFLPYIVLQQLGETAESEEMALTSLREIITAGEQLRLTSSIRSFLSKLKDCQLRNQYGPTESHVVTEFVLKGSPQDWPALPPIGRPIANTQLYVLDQYLNPVPIGVPGELHIGGDGLARGYLNRPELTDEKFIANPFSDKPGARVYKTGDWVRYAPDGNIEFLGRIDQQVKIRGFRIEPGEIEAVLRQYPATREAVVVAREDSPGDKRLVGYVVAKQESAPTAYALRQFLKETLPEYMLPGAFVFLASLPLTPNGKVDHRALPGPDHARPESEEVFVSSRTPVEVVLATIWTEVLGVKRVGIHDNFFDLGGHSLLGIRLISRLREEFQIDLPVRSLFEFPTIAGLGARIDAERKSQILSNHRETEPRAFLVPLQSKNSGRPIFLLPGGIGGEPEFIVYARLVHYVGSGYSFYGFKARSADGTKKAHVRVEEMAADYIKEMQALQPQGPYYLVGECIGGIVAYEIACQLEIQGQEVALLALMDTHCPTRAKYLRYRAGRLMQAILANYYVVRAGFHWEQMQQLKFWDKLAYLLTKGSTLLSEGSHLIRQSMLSNGNGNSTAMEQARSSVQEGYMETLRRYRPRPYGGRMSLLVNENSYQRDPALGWAHGTAIGIEIHKLPGDHTSYIREHVQVAAKQLRECLEKAETKS
ncbi:MAG TPA: amino acid adenylation domain-containing protein, partial [Methylomirabilota bacterium]|nr:amino acid adenylation domain-containing protein [Methylomirabilota bacterium]